MEEKDSRDLLGRLKKIEGQMRGIQKLINDKKDCEVILQQISAARSALYKVGIQYISSHLKDCLIKKEKLSPKLEENISRFINVLGKFT